MGEQDPIEDVIRKWSGAWRQPVLFGLAVSPRPLGTHESADAVLKSLAEPVVDVMDGFQRLLDAGDFRACRALLKLPGTGLSDEQRTTLKEQIDRSTAAVRTNLLSRSHQLGRRAVTLGTFADTTSWLKALVDGKQDAMDLLDRAEEELDRRAEKRSDAIRARFADLDVERRRIAEACLDNGEFTVAERVVSQGDFQPWLHSPTAVQRPTGWTFRHVPAAEILLWFTGDRPATADFGEHLPVQSDNPAWMLIHALREVFSDLTEDSASGLGEALDRFMNDTPINYRPQQVGDGYQVDLCGFTDPRLPWLGVPRLVGLHIGGTPPHVGRKPQVWLPTGEDRPELPEGVAVLEPSLLFALAEPDGAGRAPSTPWRRINILRRLCAQLPFDQVVNVIGTDLGEEGDIRVALQWMFDVLDYRPSPEVPDMVLYYTNGIPAALAALVRELTRLFPGRGSLTHDHLAAMRKDPAVAGAVRDAVFAPLEGDVQATVVFGALLLCAATLGDNRVAPDDLTAELDLLTEVIRDQIELEEGRRRELPPERIAMAEAVDRIEAAGLATGGTRIALAGQGLVDLLLVNEDLSAWTIAALRRLHDLGDQVEENARLLLVNRTTRQNHHAVMGYEYAIDQLAHALRGAGGQDEREILEQQIGHIEKLVEEYRAIERGDVQSLLRTSTFDVVELVTEFAGSERHTGRAEVQVVNEVGAVAEVTAIRLLVRLALVDLALNAAQAMDAAKSGRRAIRITVCYEDRDDERFVVIGVEDSGPGFGQVDPAALDQVRKNRGMPGGEGLRNVRRNLEACRGRLEQLPSRSDLGGAHLRIWLPLSG